jgi:uncharacterized membrane protein YfcA
MASTEVIVDASFFGLKERRQKCPYRALFVLSVGIASCGSVPGIVVGSFLATTVLEIVLRPALASMLLLVSRSIASQRNDGRQARLIPPANDLTGRATAPARHARRHREQSP